MNSKQKHPHKKPKSDSDMPKTIEGILAEVESQDNEILGQVGADLEEKVLDLENKNVRLRADMDNMHKQHAIEVAGARKTGKRTIASSVVELINTINLSFAFVPADADEKFKHYVDTLRTSLKKAQSELDAVGLTLLIPTVGEQFDAVTMQALNASDKLTVAQVVSVGYKIDDQVIAPAVIMLG